MSSVLYRLLSKLNFTAKDRADFIKEISSSSGGGGGNLEDRVRELERKINEITENPKLALRYQNKYRNLLRFEKQRVLDMRHKIIEVYGNCYDPYKEVGQKDVLLTKLKKEINGLCDRILLEKTKENEELKRRVLELEKENERLLALKKSSLENHFTLSQDNVL